MSFKGRGPLPGDRPRPSRVWSLACVEHAGGRSAPTTKTNINALGEWMNLSRASGYALQAIVVMIAGKDSTPVASHLTAKAEGIPEKYLLKILLPLVKAGVLLSAKGPTGGYRLAKPPAK